MLPIKDMNESLEITEPFLFRLFSVTSVTSVANDFDFE